MTIRGRDWRLGSAWGVLVVLAACAITWPDQIAPGLLMILPVAAAAFATPRAVAQLAAAGVSFAVTAIVVTGDDRPAYLAGRILAWIAVGAGAYLLARQRAVRDAQLAELATHDPLTGLANRRLLHERLDAQLGVRGRTAPSAVLYLDLDDFKGINDRFGHQAGDAVLVSVADQLRACVRSEDTVARVGGDEFVIACPDVEGAPGLTHLCERITEALSRPVLSSDGHLVVSASIGAVLVPAGVWFDVDELIELADEALIEQKRSDTSGFRIRDIDVPVQHPVADQ